jgi:hypothetical protein
MSIEKLDIKQLQAALLKLAKPLQADFAPLLYHLREKMREPGRKGGGWGVWVRKHLPLSLSTATNWANEYGKKHDLPVAPKRTSSKSVRGSEVFPFFTMVRPGWFTKAKERKFLKALHRLGEDEAARIMVEAVLEATNGKALSAHA